MSVVRYLAVDRGNLIAGHSEQTEYLFEVPFSSMSTSESRQGRAQTSLSGKPFYTLHHVTRSHSLTTVNLHRVNDANTIASMEEMFSSVAAGETFFIDIYGTAGTPDNERSFVLDGGFSKAVTDVLFVQFSFKVVEL